MALEFAVERSCGCCPCIQSSRATTKLEKGVECWKLEISADVGRRFYSVVLNVPFSCFARSSKWTLLPCICIHKVLCA